MLKKKERKTEKKEEGKKKQTAKFKTEDAGDCAYLLPAVRETRSLKTFPILMLQRA